MPNKYNVKEFDLPDGFYYVSYHKNFDEYIYIYGYLDSNYSQLKYNIKGELIDEEEKIIINLAIIGLDNVGIIAEAVELFNRDNKTYRIVTIDYTIYNKAPSYEQAIDELDNEYTGEISIYVRGVKEILPDDHMNKEFVDYVVTVTDEDKQKLFDFFNSTDVKSYTDKTVTDIVNEEYDEFYASTISAEEAAKRIQNRVYIYYIVKITEFKYDFSVIACINYLFLSFVGLSLIAPLSSIE